MILQIILLSVLWSSLLYGQQWEFIAPMPEAREGIGIATLDGGEIAVVGVTEKHSGIYEPATYVYDPVLDTWTTHGTMNIPRVSAPLVKLLDGRLFYPSGLRSDDTMTQTCEIYTPSTGVWKFTKDDLKRPRCGESAITLPNGNVLIVGGMDWETQTTHATCELYDPELDTIIQTGNISQWQTGTMLFLDTARDKIIMQSGYFILGGAFPLRRMAEEYDIATGSWTATAASKVAHYTYPQQSIQLPNGDILVPSGYSDSGTVAPVVLTPLIEIYTPETKTWRTLGALSKPRYLATTVYIGNDSALIVGGYSAGWGPNPNQDCQIINTSTGMVTPAPPLQIGRYYHRAVVRTYSDTINPEVEVTAVYVFGGFDLSGQPLASCEKIEFRRKKQSSGVAVNGPLQQLKSFFDSANDQLICTDNIPSDHKIELFDALGKVVFSRMLRGDEHRVEVSAAGLPSGLYVFQATTATGRLSSKVLLTH